MGSIGIAAAAFSFLSESTSLDISRYTLSLSNSSPKKKLRLLHISDIHAYHFVPFSFIERSIEHSLALQPDVIFITGDFINRRIQMKSSYMHVLKKLSGSAPTFACPGNHDGGRWIAPHGGYSTSLEVRRMLEQCNISCLVNDAEAITLNRRPVNIIGLGDILAGECNPQKAFSSSKIASDALTVIISHNPDSKENLTNFSFDLLLCGHTHGGQVRIPLIGPPVIPVIDKRYIEGLYRWNGNWLHISRGLGSLYGLRINCKPQITLISV